MSWLKTGFNTVVEEAERRDSEVKVPELWMNVGHAKEVMFLDSTPACVHTHTVKVHGEWMTFTCLGDTGAEDVPCCEILGTKKRQFQGYFTVVDLSPYKDRNGNVHVNEVKLFPAKFKTLKLIQEVLTEQGTLNGKVIKLKRMEDKSPSSGDYVGYVRDQALPELKFRGKPLAEVAKDTEKFSRQISFPKDRKGLPVMNYMEILAPKSPGEIRAMLRGYKPPGDEGASSGGKAPDDDTPF